MQKIKRKITLHPIMTFLILMLITIVLSGILGIFNFSTNYNMINTVRGSFETTTVAVTSLFNLSGLKLIFRTTVANFAAFAPLATLLIILIGIGIMDRSGFLQSFFALITHNANKFRVTWILSLILVLASIMGDIAFIVFIPIVALFFKYSMRNPKVGIILAFASLTCGTGVNIFMNSIDSSLLEYTRLATTSLDSTYEINTYAHFFIMIVMTILLSYVIALITEKNIAPKLGKYEVEEDNIEEFYLDKKKKRGLLFSLSIGLIYTLVFIYNIIPGLPISGSLLDYSQTLYIDKLFGYNSFFNQGFVFIITFLFFILGFFYGIGAKTIKNNRDVCEYFGHSLDDIGKSLVLIFFASTLISIFKESGIGNVLVAYASNYLASANFSGISLIIISFLLVVILTIFVPSPVTSWSILSSSMVPVYMNAGMTPEFSMLVFRAAHSVAYGLTPLMAYFVVYLLFMDKYSEEEKPINLFTSIKYILPYALATLTIWLTLIIIAYVVGLPIGIGATSVL